MAAEEATTTTIDEQEGSTPDAEKRERSSIEFPYGDLDDAVELAQGVHHVGGSGCETEQLAAQLNQAASGGGFRQRMLTAKTFGLVTYSQGRINLTQLGSRICDPQQERLARAEAFLTVPLYKAVYERFKGNTLPPATGLESEMVTMGVAKKQKDKARQVFQRSATQAGFFWSGPDRLVMPARGNAPPIAKTTTDEEKQPERQRKGGDGGSGGGDGGGQHPFVRGLIDSLPQPESPWPLDKRAKWLQAASKVFDLMYEDAAGSIEIKVVKEPTP